MTRTHAAAASLSAWFDTHARPLPWRDPGTSPWAILVCEVMSQQTPVARVAPIWEQWLERWPTPAALAAASPADVVRAWSRLGYPRRALRLRDAASAIVERHGGVVPVERDDLLALPGVGAYTAAAVRTFAHGVRDAVIDTNIARVWARAYLGQEFPPASLSGAARAAIEDLVPREASEAVAWNAAVMELGATVCLARNPRCGACPLAGECRWLAAGRPAWSGPARRGQAWEGTHRQRRGRILAALRGSDASLPRERFAGVGSESEVERALASLIEDQLIVPVGDGRYALPD